VTRTQWVVVIGLLSFILAIFGILLFQLQVPNMPATPAPPPFLLEEEAQARRFYPVAQQEALLWREDAQLASAGVVWDDLGPGGILKRDRWTFEFYSPSEQRMAVIRMVDGKAERLRTALLPNRLPALPLERWQMDSSQALQIWWERGGGDFVRQHARISISLKLRMEPQGTRLLWIVAGSSSGQHSVVQIDAGDGTVLE